MIGEMLSKEKHDIVLLQEVGETSSLEYLSSMYLLYLVKTETCYNGDQPDRK